MFCYQCDDCGQGTQKKYFEEENIVLNCTFYININSFLYCLLLICTYFCKKRDEYYNKQKKYVYYKNYYGKLKKTKKHLNGLSSQWGGGLGLSPLFMFFFYF